MSLRDNALAAAARYNRNPCSKTARATKFGMPYVLVCQWKAGHRARCKDIDNGAWFDPDPPTA